MEARPATGFRLPNPTRFTRQPLAPHFTHRGDHDHFMILKYLQWYACSVVLTRRRTL
jgi:hypothetical protein